MLNDITLRNFKAFSEITVPLGNLTLLTGLNSSGKSTVLHALGLLRQSWEAGTLLSQPHLDSGFALNGDMVELGTGRDARHEAWVATDQSGAGNIEIAVSGSTENLDGKWSWSAGYAADDDFLEFTGEPFDTDWLNLALFSDGFQYLRADRINPAASYPRSTRSRRGFLGARGEYTVNVLRQHQDDETVQLVHHPAAISATLLRQTEAWLGHLCPGINLTASGIEGTDTVQLAYSHGTGGIKSSNKYRPTNVGFGLTYVLPIIVACLTASPDGLIMIENPEAHLHPRGQSAMAELIVRAAATGAQVIVESHSDHVLNGIRIAVKQNLLSPTSLRLLYFRNNIDSNTPFEMINVGPTGTISQWPEGFFDEWDRALDDLID